MTTQDPIAPPAPLAGPDAATVLAADWPMRPLRGVQGLRTSQYQAIVRRVALDAIHGHGKSITAVEICGVLVGNVYHDEQGPYLYISDAIRGDRASGLAAQVTFTAETWSEIQAVMDRDHPDKRIVGWYHTHPGFGVFLSGMDLFIQDHFFNLPWQVALVYDPIGGDEGLFFWREGKADRQAFLIEEEDTREHAQTMAEMEAAESLAPVPVNPPPRVTPLAAPRSAPEFQAEESWTGVERRSTRRGVPGWLIGAVAFAISFACALWAMYSMQSVVIVPHHIDRTPTLLPLPGPGENVQGEKLQKEKLQGEKQ